MRCRSSETAGMARTLNELLVPYTSSEDAKRATSRGVWAVALLAVGYAGAVCGVLLSEPSGSPGPGAEIPSFLFGIGPMVALLVLLGERKKLDQAAGRKLESREVTVIRNATAAGQLVDNPDLIAAQEYFARRHMKLSTAAVTGGLTTLFVLVPLVALLWFGALTPLIFGIAAACVTLGSLYLVWGMLRRAAGGAATNAIFDEPLSPKEEAEL